MKENKLSSPEKILNLNIDKLIEKIEEKLHKVNPKSLKENGFITIFFDYEITELQFDIIKKMYIKIGWKNVTIHEDTNENHPDSYYISFFNV